MSLRDYSMKRMKNWENGWFRPTRKVVLPEREQTNEIINALMMIGRID